MVTTLQHILNRTILCTGRAGWSQPAAINLVKVDKADKKHTARASHIKSTKLGEIKVGQ